MAGRWRWSERRDLNPRPFGPEPNALPDCATLRRCFQTCQAENRCEVYYFLSHMSIGGECCRGECCQLETGNWDWQQWQHFIWCACAQPRKPAGGGSPCGDLNEGAPPHGLRLRLAVGVAPSLSPVGSRRTAGHEKPLRATRNRPLRGRREKVRIDGFVTPATQAFSCCPKGLFVVARKRILLLLLFLKISKSGIRVAGGGLNAALSREMRRIT